MIHSGRLIRQDDNRGPRLFVDNVVSYTPYGTDGIQFKIEVGHALHIIGWSYDSSDKSVEEIIKVRDADLDQLDAIFSSRTLTNFSSQKPDPGFLSE